MATKKKKKRKAPRPARKHPAARPLRQQPESLRLRSMAASLPTTERDLLAISGVGPVKLERYGARFLELLRTVP